MASGGRQDEVCKHYSGGTFVSIHRSTSMTHNAHPDTTQRGGRGNFANDPQRASESGKKGGQHSHDNESRSSSPRTDSASEKMQADRKGGQNSGNR